jgi:D-aminoacyl-tRNA deacylase
VITVVQRVSRAAVRVDGTIVGAIGKGALLLVAVEQGDTDGDADTTASKIALLRFFPDRTPMDLTLGQVGGACLVVSQFTLAASLRKGNRPAFTAAAPPELAERLYLRVASELEATGLSTATGSFGASMAVELENDGPVTFVLRVRDGRVQ